MHSKHSQTHGHKRGARWGRSAGIRATPLWSAPVSATDGCTAHGAGDRPVAARLPDQGSRLRFRHRCFRDDYRRRIGIPRRAREVAQGRPSRHLLRGAAASCGAGSHPPCPGPSAVSGRRGRDHPTGALDAPHALSVHSFAAPAGLQRRRPAPIFAPKRSGVAHGGRGSPVSTDYATP